MAGIKIGGESRVGETGKVWGWKLQIHTSLGKKGWLAKLCSVGVLAPVNCDYSHQ